MGPAETGLACPPRDYIDVPAIRPPTIPEEAAHLLKGTLLSPVYWVLACTTRAPGLKFRGECARLAWDFALSRRAQLSWREVLALLLWPMDSVRYFEFDFMGRALFDLPFGRFLDVSSPRAFPVILLRRRPGLTAEMINPDPEDLRVTRRWVDALDLQDRCRLHGCLVKDASFGPGTFDVVTSLSVLEHIPEDRQAVEKMWEMLRPGGRLVLTVPCAARPLEQYISRNPYGLLAPEADGTTFWQRFYDEGLLEERVFAVTGRPARQSVYGERRPGRLRANARRKHRDPLYPYWREPFMMGREYAYFRSVREMPGEGVIGMEFIKR